MLKQIGSGMLVCALVLGPLMLVGSTAPQAPVVQALQPRVGDVPNEIIVSFQGEVPPDFAAWAHARGGQTLLQDDSIHWVSLRLADRAMADATIQAALLRSDVKNAQHDGYMSAQFTPNDPLYAQQADWIGISAPAAWDAQRGGHSVKVAVLDTGVYLQHPDLAANICGPVWSETDEAATFDGFGHGTHVAGTIAAVQDNGVGVSGASRSCLMAGKVLDSGGSGQWSWGAKGIVDAANFGADIVSMSWGGGYCFGSGCIPIPPADVLTDSVFYAYHTKGVLLVAAAGNNGCAGNSEIFPAEYQDVMAVAALNENGVGVAGFSSCGPDVEIAAPGANVLSTMRPCSAPICSNSGYGRISGTSMATPHVSGVAALVKAAHADLNNDGLRCLLDLSAKDQGQPGKDTTTGWGRLDAAAALAEADSLIDQLGSAAQVNTACSAVNLALGAGGVPDAPTCLANLAPVRPCDSLPA
ncbi:MAG: S8 family serine peptidase [Halobacteriales archaeon]|nr:S8 family serine peptidase [Halobacteriales archaeon]